MNLTYFDTALGFAAVMLMLSMLVTILVQMVTTALNVRGTNLVWGIERVIGQLIPGDSQQAKVLAQRLLRHHALSHSFGRYAVAIRPKEFSLVLQDLADSKPDQKDKVGVAIQAAAEKVLEKLMTAKDEALAWFNTIMDRTTERFVMRTRIWTAVFAFGLAFALHIDTLHIFKQLSAKPEVRAALVTAALKHAVPYHESIQKQDPLPVEAIRALAKDNAAHAKALGAASGATTRAEGRAWIAKTFPDPGVQKKLIEEYEARLDALGRKRIEDLQNDYEKVRGWIEASQLELGPAAEYCAFKSAFDWTCTFKGITPGHMLGMLVTALFLSLGAPFWFNALRNMSNLRPILAGKVEEKHEKPA